MITVLILAIGTFFCTGCSKDGDYADSNHSHSEYAPTDHRHSEIQTIVKKFTATYNGAGQQIAECYYSGLSGQIGEDDAVLVYTKTNTNATGTYFYWTAQPYVENGYSFYYQIGDTGLLYLYADAGEGYTWTGDFQKLIKVIIIPHQVYTDNCAKGVDHNNYEMVVKAYHLEDVHATDLDIETSK